MNELEVCYPFELHQSLRRFSSSHVIPCSALFNNKIVGGFLFICSKDDLKFFNITFLSSPQPGLNFRFVNSDNTSYLIEIYLIFDADKTLKFHLNPAHPTVKMLFNLLKTEGKIALHFYNRQTDIIASTYTILDDDKMNWLTRNTKLMSTLGANSGYQELVKYITKNMVKNDKLFKFDDSERIEQTFILKNSKVVKLL